MNLHLKTYFFIDFREKGREGEKEREAETERERERNIDVREKHVLVASKIHPN